MIGRYAIIIWKWGIKVNEPALPQRCRVEILAIDSLGNFSEEKIRKHPVVGCRILNMFDETLDIAECVYEHYERRDGNGYPRGLKGDRIPLISRIILVSETYECEENQGDQPLEERKAASLKVIREGSG